jgi:hypothetical protein
MINPTGDYKSYKITAIRHFNKNSFKIATIIKNNKRTKRKVSSSKLDKKLGASFFNEIQQE